MTPLEESRKQLKEMVVYAMPDDTENDVIESYTDTFMMFATDMAKDAQEEIEIEKKTAEEYYKGWKDSAKQLLAKEKEIEELKGIVARYMDFHKSICSTYYVEQPYLDAKDALNSTPTKKETQ